MSPREAGRLLAEQIAPRLTDEQVEAAARILVTAGKERTTA